MSKRKKHNKAKEKYRTFIDDLKEKLFQEAVAHTPTELEKSFNKESTTDRFFRLLQELKISYNKKMESSVSYYKKIEQHDALYKKYYEKPKYSLIGKLFRKAMKKVSF